MRHGLTMLIASLLATGCNTHAQDAVAPAVGNSGLLTQVQTIPLDGVEGRIDHFALDAAGKRLFVAALGNDTVEVIDLTSGKVAQQIKGLHAPQGVAFAPESNRLAVASDKDGSVRLYDGASLRELKLIDLKDDADNVRYNAAARRFWVGYGEGALAAIDPESGKILADIKLDGHPESFQLETKGTRIFVNVPNAGHVAVVDREKGTVIAKWPLEGAASNFPMALDEAQHRLFIGCRNPATLLVLDTQNGKTVARLDIVGDTDDVFYDGAQKRLYVCGGEGGVTIITQSDGDTYKVAGRVTTAPGARTSFFVPDTALLYVAVPHRKDQKAELRVFRVGATQ